MNKKIMEKTAIAIMYSYIAMAVVLLFVNCVYIVSEENTISDADLAKTPAIISKNVVSYELNERYMKTAVMNVENVSAVKHIELDTILATYDIPKNRGFKSFMPYTAITCGKQKQLQKLAITSEKGIRTVENRYCAAIGTHFDIKIGQWFDLVLENGEVIPCILADVKADAHTDSDNIFTVANGCCSEFVVDTPHLPALVKKRGNVSFMCEEWNSPVTQIVTYEKNTLEEVAKDE